MAENDDIWKFIEGYEGFFMISNFGALKVCQREICQGLKISLPCIGFVQLQGSIPGTN